MPREKKVKEVVKFTPFQTTRLTIPKDPFLYKLRRAQWLLMNYSKQLEKDPLAVPLKDYMIVVDLYASMCEEAHKKGLNTRDGRRAAVAARMDKEGVGESRDAKSPNGTRPSLPPGMGAGV